MHRHRIFYSIAHTDINRLLFRLWFIVKRKFFVFFGSYFQKKYYGRLHQSFSHSVDLDFNRIHFRYSNDNFSVKYDIDSIELTILNRTRKLKLPFIWHDAELDDGTRLWKINLHAMEYLELIEDYSLIEKIILDWIDQNPPYLNDYHKDSWNSYTTSIRVPVWIRIYLKYNNCMGDKFRRKFLNSIEYQTSFLLKNLEMDIRGNHLIKNFYALIYSSSFIPKYRSTVRKVLKNKLAKEMQHQFYKSGLHFELSPEYHKQVFWDLLNIYVVGSDVIEGRIKFEKILEKMLYLISAFNLGNNYYSRFNDTAPDLKVSTEDIIKFGSEYLIVRPRERQTLEHIAPCYYLINYNNIKFLIKTGKVGDSALPAHAHADIFSFELIFNDLPFVVDIGVYEYNNTERRRYSRSTTSHNTISVAGLNQVDVYGSFRMGRRFAPLKPIITNKEESIEVGLTYNGWEKLLRANLSHSRKVKVAENSICITDIIEGTIIENYESNIHLHPDVHVENNLGNIKLSNGNYHLHFKCNKPVNIQDYEYYPSFGEIQIAQRLNIAGTINASSVEYMFSQG